MKKEDLQNLLKETSPQDLWEGLKKVEESLEGVEVTIEDLEQLIFNMVAEEASENEEKSLPEDEVLATAKTKGLPTAEGGVVKKYMGVTLSSAKATYDDSAVTKAGTKGKKELSDYQPTSEELAKINQLTNVDLKAEEVLVFSLHSADDQVDRSADQFTGKALKDMAAKSVNKPYLKDHNWTTDSVIGKIFDASVSKGRLMQKVFVPITAKNQDMITGMLTATHDKVSVGFAMSPENYSCSSCSKSLYSMDCPHYPGSKDEKGNITVGIIKGVQDYYEISNVVVPCQPNAGIRRDNQKSLSTEAKALDRISNEILSTNGEDPVSDVPKSNEDSEAETKAIEAPEAPAEDATDVSKEASAPEAPIVKAVDVEEVAKAAIAPLLDEMKSLIAELKSTLAAKAEVEKSAEEESTEEVARKLLASSIESPVETKGAATAVDFNKSGWLMDLGKALQSRDSQ